MTDDDHFSQRPPILRPAGEPSATPPKRRDKKMRHTRDHRTSSPVAYFALHRKGFAVPPPLLTSAVGSYPTFSP